MTSDFVLTLLDHEGKQKDVLIGPLNSIQDMFMIVLSGDESLFILYKDEKTKWIDTGDKNKGRVCDDTYLLYSSSTIRKMQMIETGDFQQRTTSLWRAGERYALSSR